MVSHVAELKARLERALEIAVHPAGSRVSNAAPRRPRAGPPRPRAALPAPGARPAARPAPAPEPEDREPPAALPPDPEHAGNVYCEACRQSLGAARAARHLASAKHAAAQRKAAGGARR